MEKKGQARIITLDCNNYYINNPSFTIPGIYSDSSNTTIKNCNVSVSKGAGFGVGIRLTGNTYNRVLDNILNSNLVGIYSSSSNNNVFENNVIKDNVYGSYLESSSDSEFETNNICLNTNDLICSSSQIDLGSNSCSGPGGCGITCNSC
tara:strand:+ start:3182 stop:3628 length:447 start_codon:yes stop_codon:yes gene_type:complete